MSDDHSVSVWIIGCRTVAVPVPASFVRSLRSAFDWYTGEYLGNSADNNTVVEMLANALAEFEAPGLGWDEVHAICGDVEKAKASWERLTGYRNDGVPTDARFDCGGRVYHCLTNVRKEIRRRFTCRGSPIVEVDMHATYVAILAAKLAEGDERARLIQMLQTRDFYGEFARLANVSGDNVKQRFQRDVVFSYKPHNELWDAFKKHFPQTARRLSAVRDWGPVVNVERCQDVNGRWYTRRTRAGQRHLSRRLSRTEASIFLHRALIRLAAEGVVAVPVHDCLMVRECDAAATLAVLRQAAFEVLGFEAVFKSSRAAELVAA